jgi:NAD(P)-dependent dehydrogenase (short-subunit alcohol dehydrogenase family)
MDIVKDEGMIGKLSDKVILITGASAGIGVETAHALHATGAHLFLTTRDVQKGQKVVDTILAEKVPTGGKVELIQLKLDDLQSVRECAAAFLQRSKQLNILILNAGIMACPDSRTKDGFETQFGTNHLGHFLLFELLKETLLASSTPAFNSRVVSLSSSGHRQSPILFDDLDLSKGGYEPFKAYGQSKTANIYLANEIERRYGSQGLHATSVMPGGIFTELARHVVITDPAFVERLMKSDVVKKVMKNAEQGAATTVCAAIGKEWEGKGGKYLEDCRVAPATDPSNTVPMAPGYADHAYDEAAAQKLWDVSLQLVGLENGE